MIPFFLILLASAVSLTEGILIKKRDNSYDKEGFCFTAIVSFFSMLFFVGKSLITNGYAISLSTELLPYALLGGICYASASFLTYIALGCGSFTISMLILSYGGIFSIDDDKISFRGSFQIPKTSADALHTGTAHHVTYCQNLKIHNNLLKTKWSHISVTPL